MPAAGSASASPDTSGADAVAPQKPRSLLGTLIRLAVSAGAIGLVLAFTDFNDVLAHMGTQNLALALLALVCMAGQLACGALRWHSITRGLGGQISLGESFRLFVIGSFFGSYVLTSISGDVFRAVSLARSGVDAARATQSVVFDRIATLAAVAMMVVLASPWLLAKFGMGAASWMPLAFALTLAVLIFVAAYFHRLPEAWFELLPMRLLKAISEGMHAVFMRPGVAARALLAAILAQTAYAAAAWCLALSLGLSINPIDCLVIMQLVAVLGALPISVGGWGVREVSMVSLMGLIAVPPASALLLSVELGLLGLLTNLPGGLVWLVTRPQQRANGLHPAGR